MNAAVSPPGAGAFWSGEIDYHLPPELVAQRPADRREGSRLMVVARGGDVEAETTFASLTDHLPPGALLVANDSRVVPSRLHGAKVGSGGVVEALLLGLGHGAMAEAMVRVSKPLREGQHVDFGDGVVARVVDAGTGGRATFDFSPLDVASVLARIGKLPLPPYIERPCGPTAEDEERYQTVYARAAGSVAAPTAGLHFTPALLDGLRARGHGFATVTLHVGPGTFTPVRGGLEGHRMDEERFEIPEEAAAAIAAAKRDGRAVVAVGTTTVRALESAADGQGGVRPGPSASSLFIRPPWRFHVVDALVTNFHLPGSTLIALVSALAGRDTVGRAYARAIEERYRFYSYGDAMLIR